MGELQAQSGNMPPISAWLDVLGAVMPPRGTLIVGAGAGNSQWIQWLKYRNIHPVWLIEGDKGQYQHLERSLPSELEWTLRHQVVAETTDLVEFHHASNPAESGLLPPEQQHCLWPHLEPRSVEEMKAITLAALFTEGAGDINWLVLDCLPASSLLTGGRQQLCKLDVVLIRVTMSDDLPSASLKAADTLLSEAGLRRIQVLPERHPALAHAIYVRDIADQAADIERMKLDIDQLLQALQKAQLKLDQQQAEYAVQLGDTRRQAEEEINTVRQQMAMLQQHTEQQNLRLQSAEQRHKTLHQELDLARADKDHLQRELGQLRADEQHLRHELLSANNNTESQALELARLQGLNEGKLSEQHSLLDKIVTTTNQLVQQQTQLTQLQQQGQKDLSALVKKELDARLGKAVRHVEAFIAIQQYLTHGDGITGFHGWPISPDLGVFLLELLRERQYDAIIEFGSGTSTLLIAKALQAFNLLEDGDSKRILSFDHDAYYFEKTQKQLVAHQVDSLVDLRLAPLAEWSDETGHYQYYSCQDALSELVERLQGSSKRILVLVDGPPGSTCPNARYPAVPFMSDLLANHEIDWILDDAYRPDEKLSADLWKNIWSINHIRFADEIIKNEKGMFFSTTYGNTLLANGKAAS